MVGCLFLFAATCFAQTQMLKLRPAPQDTVPLNGLPPAASTQPLKRQPAFPTTQPPSVVPSVPQKQQISLPHLYWHFLLYQNHLDRAAAAHEKQGKDGAWLRDHFQKRLAFTPAQFNVVRQSAQSLEPQLRDIQSKAMVVVQADREMAGIVMPTGRPPVPGGVRNVNQPRPGRAQLKQLQLQHEAAIQSEMNKLQQALGPELAAKLDNFLQTDWSRHVTSTHFRPHPGTPLRVPNRPFVQGVRP
jgi:hypothetical protein